MRTRLGTVHALSGSQSLDCTEKKTMSDQTSSNTNNTFPYQIVFEWNDDDFYQNNMATISRLPTPEVVAEKTEIALRASMATIQDIGERMATTMSNMPYPPQGAEINFGIRLGAESGVITKDNQTAHFLVKLIWTNQDPDTRPK